MEKGIYRLLLSSLLIVASFFSLTAQDKPIVDYREFQSAIKNQKDRGTCTAFAVVAAMETFSGVPSDLSEQYIYAWAKLNHYKEMAEYTEGAPLSFYCDILKKTGTVSETEVPYQPSAPLWTKDASKFEAMKADIRASLWDMLSFQDYAFKLDEDQFTLKQGKAAKDIAWLKQQLDNGVKSIPVGYAVSGKYWSQQSGRIDEMLDPADFLDVKIGDNIVHYGKAKLFNEKLAQQIVNGEIEAKYSQLEYRHDEGHAVAIVGYSSKGFLIKNSWGTDWADGGYAWISFDYHMIFCDEALVIRSIKFFSGAGDENNVWQPNAYQLKVTPYYYNNEVLKMHTNGAELSLVWNGTGKPEPLAEVQYRILDVNGKQVEETYGYVQGIFANLGEMIGHPAHVLDKKFGLFIPNYTVEVNAKSKSGKQFSQRYTFSGRKNACYSIEVPSR